MGGFSIEWIDTVGIFENSLWLLWGALSGAGVETAGAQHGGSSGKEMVVPEVGWEPWAGEKYADSG